MAAEPVVRALHEAELAHWDRLVAASPEGSVYSTPQYLDVLCRAAGGSYQLIGVWMGEELCGGIALYQEARWFGRCAGPRLLLYYHSPIVRAYETAYPSQRTARHLRIFGALAAHLAQLGLVSAVLKCRHSVTDVRPFASAGWGCVPSYTYVVPLADLTAQWRKVEQNQRRLIKRAEGKQLELHEGQDADEFYVLHADTMARKGARPYLPRDAFRVYFHQLRALNLCRLYLARFPDGAVAAGQLVLLGPGADSHTVMAATDEAHLPSGASAFLRWKAFEALSALGYTGNDLTDAALNPVTRFKSQFGGRLELCHVLHLPKARWSRLAYQTDEAARGFGRVLGRALGGVRRAAQGKARGHRS